MSLSTGKYPVVCKGEYLLVVLQGQEGGFFQDSSPSPQEGRKSQLCSTVASPRVTGTNGATAGPSFPFVSGQCPPPEHRPTHQLCFPTSNQTCNPSPACPSLDRGISYAAGNYYFTYSKSPFSEIKHPFEINRSFPCEQKKSSMFDPRGRSRCFYECI